MDYVDSLLKSCRTPHYKTRWRTERPPCCHHSVGECKQSTKLFTPNLTITNFICLWHITLVTLLNYYKLSCAKTLNRVFHGFTIYTKSIPKVFNRIWCPIDAVLYVPFREMFLQLPITATISPLLEMVYYDPMRA